MTSFIDKCWFGKSPYVWLLLPFSWFYWLVTALRRLFFKIGLKKTYRSKVPVIVVGNIMTGGNGKTPVVIAITKFLQHKKLRVGVVSRGYGAKPTSLPLIIDNPQEVEASVCGDEPKLIALKTHAIVAVDPIRVRAVKAIEDKVDVIVTDDGLQHYYLDRDVEIVVTDGKRRLGNGHLLPAGPLREGKWRLQKVDYQIVNGGKAQAQEVQMTLKANTPWPLNQQTPPTIEIKQIGALAGIGDPQRFYTTLQQLGYQIAFTIDVGDHQLVDLDVLTKMTQYHPVIMTEKDMVKYPKEQLTNCYAVGVEAQLPNSFYESLWQKVTMAQTQRKAFTTHSS